MARTDGSRPGDDGLDDLWIIVRRRLADRLRDEGLSKRDRWVMSQLSMFFHGHAPNPPEKTSWIPFMVPTYAVAPTPERQRGTEFTLNGSGEKADCDTRSKSPTGRSKEAHCSTCGATIVTSPAVGSRRGR